MPRPLLNFSQSDYLIQVCDTNSNAEWQTVQIQSSWFLQKPTDLDLHCLQRQGISGFSRTRVNGFNCGLCAPKNIKMGPNVRKRIFGHVHPMNIQIRLIRAFTARILISLGYTFHLCRQQGFWSDIYLFCSPLTHQSILFESLRACFTYLPCDQICSWVNELQTVKCISKLYRSWHGCQYCLVSSYVVSCGFFFGLLFRTQTLYFVLMFGADTNENWVLVNA